MTAMAVEPISASLSILASIIGIAASIKDLMKKRNLEKQEALILYEEEANDKERELLQDVGIRESILDLVVISAPLLNQLAHEAQNCETKHIEARKVADAAGSQIDKDIADNKAGQCMCNVLRDIMRYNKKEFPDGRQFKNWWDSYGCTL